MSLGALRALLFENWGLKLLSLAFACLLWVFVVGEKRSEISLSLPLELTRVPSRMVIVSRVPESIRVRLNGPRTLLVGINPQQLAVTLDLEGLQPGTSSFEIFPSRLNIPRGVEVTHISPSVITLEADVRARKTVPVRPRTRGTPAEGFEVAEVTVTPDKVEVEGAERAVKLLREVLTEVVDVSGLEGSVSRPVELVLPDPTLRAVDKRQVQLDVVIREIRAEREFLQVTVTVPEPGWRVEPAYVAVRVAGSLRTISNLTGREVTASVGPLADPPTTGPARVFVAAPAGVQVVSTEPNVVELLPPPPAPPTPESGPQSTLESDPKPAPAEGEPASPRAQQIEE